MGRKICCGVFCLAALLASASAWSQIPFFEAPEPPTIQLPDADAAQAAESRGADAAEAIATNSAAGSDAVDSDVFGASLFRGHFAKQTFAGFNPDYTVGVGDLIDLKMWGAFDFAAQLPVDSQGNIFIPRVGPVNVANTRNSELNRMIEQRVKDVYRENVGVYAALATAEPVKVFVTGHVNAPGLYGAFASDSPLHFLDRAGGINLESGSFLDVRVQRSGKEVLSFNLYDFLMRGDMPLFQFQDGDTIVVGPRQSTATVTGMVANPARFEFADAVALSELLRMAGMDRRATHVQVIRNQTQEREAEYLPVTGDLSDVMIVSGDEVHVVADRRVGSIVVQLDGEYDGVSQIVMPYDSTLAQVLERIEFTPHSNLGAVQIFRQSIARRQKDVIEQMLRTLEQSVLSARSKTRDEAQLRVTEAQNVMRFIQRAREVEPRGRLVLHAGFDPSQIDMQDGDVVVIPRQTNTVAVHGEVIFPTSFAWREGKSVDYYIEQAGGTSQPERSGKVMLVRPNGELVANPREGLLRRTTVSPGDEIMVLPKVESKNFQFGKEIAQVISQIAISAGVILSI